MSVKKFTLFLVNLCALLPGSPASASTTGGYGQIYELYGTANGAVLFSVTGTGRSGIPSCGAGLPNRWALDASNVAAQAQVAVLLSAWAAHKKVWVTGTGSCTIWGDTETVVYFSVQD